MFTGVKISGFKAIPPSGLELDLRPLTLLVGPTGCGKSSVLEAIALLAQSMRTPDKIQLTPAGRLVQLSAEKWPRSHVDLLHGYDANGALSIEVSLRLASVQVKYGFSAGRFPRQHDADFEQWLAEGEDEIRFRREHQGAQFVTVARRRNGSDHHVQGEIQRLLDRGLFVIAGNVEGERKYDLEGFRLLADTVAAHFLSAQIRYVGEWRGASPLLSPDVRGDADAAGSFGQNLLRMLAASGPRSARMRDAQHAASQFGLTNLHTGVEDGILAAWFDDPFTRKRIKLDHAGSGSLQALPILADICDLDEGGTLLVEEPERGWHPSFLPAWGQVLAAAAERGVQVIATTHSPDLVLACALAIKRGHLHNDAFVAYDLQRSSETVSKLSVESDARGRLSPAFVKSYGDAEAALLGALLSVEDEPESRRTDKTTRTNRVRKRAAQSNAPAKKARKGKLRR